MPILKIEDQTIEIDNDGFIIDETQWSPMVAKALAKREGIDELTEDHLLVIDFIREYYKMNGTHPMIHLVAKRCGMTYEQLKGMFLKQPGKQAAKVAGLPKLQGCT